MCLMCCWFFFFKQKTAYEMRISDWSSDVCSSDLLAGQRLDTAHAGGHRALVDDLEQADVAGAAHMGAAAELDRIIPVAELAHGEHADLVAVFLAEQRHGAGGDRLVRRHQRSESTRLNSSH